MNDEDEEYGELLAQWGLRPTAPVQESMRGRHNRRRSLSTDDKKVRRQNNRRQAAETLTAGGDVEKLAALYSALNKASSLAEQARILDEIAKIRNTKAASARQDRELDFASTVVQQTLSPVRVHEHHTAATDWIGYEESIPTDWQARIVAEAAAWFGRVPDFVKAEGEEFSIQAEGKARQLSGAYGIQASAARQTFVQYVNFLRTQAASGLDEIQQTIDPNNSPKTTPLPTEVFDNFAPDIHPINQGVSGTESSDRAPLIQEIVNGGSGMDGGAPEKPSEHDEQDELSWVPPSGMQQDTAPGWSDGDPGMPEQGGNKPDYGKSASLIPAPSMAIGGYSYTLDDFRREAAAKKMAGGQGKAEGGNAASGCCKDCKSCTGNCCKSCKGCKQCHGGSKTAGSGLDQIQQTVDANNQPKVTGLPPETAFPLDEGFQEEWNTQGTGDAQPSKAATRKKADMFGASDMPQAVVQPNVANSPATTPPNADQAGGRGAGSGDARSKEHPAFSDDSSHIPAPAQQYAEGYASVDQSNGVERDMPGGGVTHAGSKVSSLIVTASEREHPDFRKGYGYASRWTPGTRLVSTGSARFEAGVYAGISDNPTQQKAFVEEHRKSAAKYPAMGERVAFHRRVTTRIASKNEVGTNGFYVQASTSIDLNTMAPNTTPAADGSTPINGPGRPGPLDGVQDAAAPGGPSPYNGAQPFGSPVVPGAQDTAPDPTDELVGGGGMSTTRQLQSAFRKRVQAGLLAQRQGK